VVDAYGEERRRLVAVAYQRAGPRGVVANNDDDSIGIVDIPERRCATSKTCDLTLRATSAGGASGTFPFALMLKAASARN
jgi:hypothetical protein